jgi:methionine synthase II (cobalamin-independent)
VVHLNHSNLLTREKDTSKEYKFLGSMLSGLVSRSSFSSKMHRLYRDGKATKAEFMAAITSDSNTIISKQEKFVFVSGGQLEWLDILRPIAENFSGFRVTQNKAFDYKTQNNYDSDLLPNPIAEGSIGPVTRWLRTNTFYRKPLVSGKIDCNGDELSAIMPKIKNNSIIFLPGPYSLIRMVENRHYTNLGDLATDYSRAIEKSLDNLRKKGYACIFFLEPYVGYDFSNDSFSCPTWFEKSLSISHTPEITIGAHFPKSEMELIVPNVEKSTIDFLGLDLLYSSGYRIRTSKDVFLGVVDGARVGIESLMEIRKMIQYFLESSKFSENYYIGPNDRLYDIPFELAVKKIETLALESVF